MSDEKEVYELAPMEADKPVTPPVVPPPAVPKPSAGAQLPTPPAGTRVSAPVPAKSAPGKGALLDDFDDDADFSKDPEVERALKGVRGAMAGEARPGDARPVFVKPGLGAPQVWLVVGSVLVLGAIIASAVNNSVHPVVAPLLVIYNVVLHTGTGVAAVALTAMLLGQRVGPPSLPAARMFTAVAAFLLLSNLRITLIGARELMWEELTLGALAYVAVVAGLFRLWGRTLGYLVCAHFILWVVVQIGMELSVWVRTAASAG